MANKNIKLNEVLLKKNLATILSHLGDGALNCSNLHHRKEHQNHDLGNCPVEKEIKESIKALESWLKGANQ